MNMKELRALIDDCNAKVKSAGKAAFANELKTLFDSHPELVAVRWNQYTPYFNDGNTCEFGVGGLAYKTTSTPEDAGDLEDGFDYAWGNESPLLVSLGEFRKGFIDEVLLAAFGDHVEITATRDGIEVEEYSHD
jgi:hypothetical protein